MLFSIALLAGKLSQQYLVVMDVFVAELVVVLAHLFFCGIDAERSGKWM